MGVCWGQRGDRPASIHSGSWVWESHKPLLGWVYATQACFGSSEVLVSPTHPSSLLYTITSQK